MMVPYDQVHATSQQLTHPFRLNCDKINAQLTNVAGPKQRKPFASLRRTIILFPTIYYIILLFALFRTIMYGEEVKLIQR